MSLLFGFASTESELEFESREMANSFYDTDFPVYRSMAIESNFPQEIATADFVGPPPVFSKNSSLSKPELHLFVSESGDNDLMDLLLEDRLGESAIAHVDELGFSSLSHTTVYFGEEVDSSKVTELVLQFLNENQIHSERKGVSKWVCESIVQLENVRFQIQIFSTSTGLAVEFLRLQGCSLSFSSVFRKFRAEPITADAPSRTVPLAALCTSSIENKIETESIDALFASLDIDPVEAVKMICSVLSMVSQCSELLCRLCHLLIARKEVFGVLTLATHLNQQVSASTTGGDDTLLNCYDLLVPSLVKYSFDSSLSSFIRHRSSELMKQRMAMY
jgi:hypothetical protein